MTTNNCRECNTIIPPVRQLCSHCADATATARNIVARAMQAFPDDDGAAADAAVRTATAMGSERVMRLLIGSGARSILASEGV